MAKVALGRFLERSQNLRGYLWRRAGLVTSFHFDVVFGSADDLVGHNLLFAGNFIVTTAHETLDRVDRAFGICDGLASGVVANERLALIVKSHDAWRETVPVFIGNDLGLLALHDRHDRVGCAQVDADNLFALLRCHGVCPFSVSVCRMIRVKRACRTVGDRLGREMQSPCQHGLAANGPMYLAITK